MKEKIYDVIVVGSGISGGWAAKELTENNMKTLVIERGPQKVHRQDYPHDFSNPWDLEQRGMVPEQLQESDYATQKKCYVFNEFSRDRFVNDRENPYVQEKPFDWIRGYQTGGRSLLWGRQSYRWSDLDFGANKRDGHGVDWPIRYRDLAPWYDHVEEFAGISGNRDNIPQLPDGIFQPPMPMNCVEKEIKSRIEKAFPERRMIIGRAAHLTDPKPVHTELGRGKCQYRNQCYRGCSFGAYFSSLSATLPAAERTGNLEMVHDSIARDIIFDPQTGRATGVRVVDRLTLQERVYRARIIFLCASTLGSTQLMLNSVSDHFPNGIANRSGALGRYLMDHTMSAGAFGTVDGHLDSYYSGRRPNGIYIPRFRNLQRQGEDYLRGFGYQGGAMRPSWQRRGQKAGIGLALKERLRQPGPWVFHLAGFGEMLPYRHNRVSLDPEKRDRWGIPLLRIDASWGENERKMREDMASSAVEMLQAVGIGDATPIKQDHAPGLAIHEMGTARMGRDPKTSVLNGYNQCHDVKNLFVTDGAAMASSACQNPSLTYMALTARAVDHAVKEIRAGRL
ncbi:GMC oxidoreductase [Microbulbifer litoralis]|uniref:GMC oxidoreductase n=1 Tax=Microbulbifer litoralis TaxID=2933965 RepID=UPI002028D742|nr:GMC family oxidoreductase [Microbulbifer sp. GX H0434]